MSEDAREATPQFQQWFEVVARHPPHRWQTELAAADACTSRLIRIPTGFGKTQGALLAWLWHRVIRNDNAWPRRLVWCLPMRVLVEQTLAVVRSLLSEQGLLWNGTASHEGKVGAHLLMGGVASEEWHLHPEQPAVLIGTQDMLLSRTLNRGYAAARARWPMEFGLLNQDALWVFDEVQLMDVGLATSAQVQSFRQVDSPAALRPCASWWMSATLQPSWLRSIDTGAFIDGLQRTEIPAAQQSGHLWTDVAKPRELVAASEVDAWAEKAIAAFRESGKGKLTLIVVNTVKRASQLFFAISEGLKDELPQDCLHLVHSRFRPAEREGWREAFLRRDAVMPASGRIVVATQVVEAGVDIDASVLLTELAPWPSLVQRFGRAARGGGTARVIVLDPGYEVDKHALPYELKELAGARDALASLEDVSPLGIEEFERGLDDAQRARLYPYSPQHLLLRHEWQELFDTTADLTGADLDVSRFIRSGDERDVQVFWQDLADGESPPPAVQPERAALCSVPFLAARDWLCVPKGEKLAPNKRAWVWNWIDGNWTRASRSQLVPGRVVLVSSDSGGYTTLGGWSPDSKVRVVPVPTDPAHADELADASQDGEDLSAYAWKTIATHGGEVAQTASDIADALGLPPDLSRVLKLAGKWHDLGKSHPAFQGCMSSAQRPDRSDLAKAPANAWPAAKRYRSESPTDYRPGFRHELASALALFSVLVRHAPTHKALLGPWLEVFAALKTPVDLTATATEPTADEREVLDLPAHEFDLLVFLVASHHGKVRCSLHSAPADQDYRDSDGRGFPVRGVREADELPSLELTPGAQPLPAMRLTLEPAVLGLSPRTGRSWGERVQLLLQAHGPAALAHLEACLRAADIRASRLSTPDPLLHSKDTP